MNQLPMRIFRLFGATFVLFLCACSSPSAHDPAAAGPQVSGYSCDRLVAQMKSAHGKSEREVLNVLLQSEANPAFDSSLMEKCLDQKLTINCNSESCEIKEKQ